VGLALLAALDPVPELENPHRATDVAVITRILTEVKLMKRARRNSGALRGFGADWSGSGSSYETGYLPMTASGTRSFAFGVNKQRGQTPHLRN
jgi:hypothetical protein